MEQKQLIAAIKKMDTASISDAMDKLGISCGLLGIQAVVSGNKICGEAFTVHYIPCGLEKGNVGDFIDDVEPGQVVVIDNGGRTYCTVWGDIMTYTAKTKGIEGTVIDGVCRDVAGIKELDYGVYTKGKYMVTGKERVTVDAVNIPIAISGVQVRPGDIILGDDSGVVVIPKERAEEVLEIAKHIEEVEQNIIAEVKNGSTLKVARERLGYHNLQSKNK
ncbi:demethylmenaquinone methyltransferase [Gemella bergeri ATCC 700627]|uniref:Putative 4-hydroxy-4-methyl-2-oxoglutarate aldolase n=1 Tax=Gemella bergeri ATCC 700627 TaxID=1321820 RepID=U2Q4G0_9BACL|nr:RraA family protein [Gemella bergeri]ERK57655.1 demethylmenaquinone methyltransferase [Gemella bergeri ATCC 700627]